MEEILELSREHLFAMIALKDEAEDPKVKEFAEWILAEYQELHNAIVREHSARHSPLLRPPEGPGRDAIEG